MVRISFLKKFYERKFVIIFLPWSHQFKHVFWVLKRTVSLIWLRNKEINFPIYPCKFSDQDFSAGTTVERRDQIW